MERRKFLKQGIATSIAVGGALALGTKALEAQAPEKYDLVAVKGGEPEAMFELAIKEMGGMGNYVKKNQTVVINPNMAWDAPPERAANTHPGLVKRIVEHCYKAGAKTVFVFDNTCSNWRDAYKNSGIEAAAKSAKAKVVSGASESSYREIDIPKGKILKKDKIHELIFNCDVYINVPILKDHGSGRLTIAMKNLMGINWDRRWWHRNGLHQCIADLTTRIKPNLNIVDAYRVMVKNGPRGVSTDDVVLMKSLLISEDILAVDVAAAKLFGIDPMDVAYIKYAQEMGVGEADLTKLKIKRINI